MWGQWGQIAAPILPKMCLTRPRRVTHWAPDGYKRNCDAPAFRAAYLEGKASCRRRALLHRLLYPSADRLRLVREIVEPVRAAAGTAFGTPEDIALTLEQKKDWYGLDMQFFSENPGFEPLRVLAGAGNFPNEYLPYYGPDALAAQMKNIVEYYRTGAAPQGHTYAGLPKRAWTHSFAGTPVRYARFCRALSCFKRAKGCEINFAPL